MSEQTLLEKAKGVPMRPELKGRGRFTETEHKQRLDIALAWFAREITTNQVAVVMNIKSTTVNSILESILSQAVRNGKVRVVKV